MKILVAVDPSQYTREAIRFVKSVDWPTASEVYLIHVIEMKHASPLIPSSGPSGWDRVISQARGKLVTEAKSFLEHMKKEIGKERVLTIKYLVREGLPGAEILQAMQDYGVDLIILGTRGLSNVKRFLLGSTSEWVMREASCSVLLVREKLSRVMSSKLPAQIMLATDGSSVFRHMLAMLSLVSCATPPKVAVAHVVGRPAYLEGWYWGKGKAEFKQLADQLRQQAEKDAVSHLEEVSQSIKGLGMKVEKVLCKGNPAEEIIKAAERLKAKLVLVGSKGCKGGKPIPLGAVVRKISRYVPCSVLLVRPGNSEKQ